MIVSHALLMIFDDLFETYCSLVSGYMVVVLRVVLAAKGAPAVCVAENCVCSDSEDSAERE